MKPPKKFAEDIFEQFYFSFDESKTDLNRFDYAINESLNLISTSIDMDNNQSEYWFNIKEELLKMKKHYKTLTINISLSDYNIDNLNKVISEIILKTNEYIKESINQSEITNLNFKTFPNDL